MTEGSATLSQGDFASTAASFGFRYTRLSPAKSLANGQAPLFAGWVGLHAFPCGLSACASDLTALHTSTHEGYISRSLTIALSLDGATRECLIGTSTKFLFRPGSAAMVAVVDPAPQGGTIGAGMRSRCLLIRANPEDMADEELAERVDQALRSTSVTPFSISPRAYALANELFSPGLPGGAGRLLTESCALELLARSPLFITEAEDQGAAPVTRRDRERMMIVRDALMADPGGEHHLSDLARQAGVSVTALKTKFTAVFGQPVFAFLRDIRLEQARRGLEREGWTVAQASYHAGYRHPTSFGFAFRRKFGLTPKDLRRR